MKLVRLDKEEIFKNKKIICIEKSIPYLEELYQRYRKAYEDIIVILDDNPRNQKPLQFGKKNIPVYDVKCVMQYNLTDKVLLITSDYYREYYDQLVSLLGESDLVDTVYFFANKETEYELFYREKYADTPLENIIVFRSGPRADAYVKGMDFADNARALFEYALAIGLNEKYELVWFVKEPDEFISYKRYPNVSFLPFHGSVSEDDLVRNHYYRVLCLAKYFFFTDAYGFVRNCRSDQIRIQLWHGCGFKKRLSSVSCEKRYEYMTVTSPLYARLHAREFGLREDQMLVTGCAKSDWLFEMNPAVSGQLGIPTAGKYIFWLPTYRFSKQKMNKPIDGVLHAETGLPLIAHLQQLELVNACLRENDIVMVIKLHPFQDRDAVHINGFSNIVLLENDLLVKHDFQMNQILGLADALISDYSSTAIDYLLLDRPIAFCTQDVETYSDSRGYIFDNILDWLPGAILENINDLLSFINKIGSDQDVAGKKRSRLRKEMQQYHDQNSSRRILEILGIWRE